MKGPKAILALILVAFLAFSIIVISIDALKIKQKIDQLQSLMQQSHSAMASVAIEEYEHQLNQRIKLLLAITVITALTLTAICCTKANVKLKSITLTLALAFIVALPTVEAQSSTRLYARVTMTTPNDYLVSVSGFIIPMRARVSYGWVAYHIGVISTEDPDWLGAGYYVNTSGAYFYIEWKVDGEYNEISAPGVSFGHTYWIYIGKRAARIGEGWFWDAYIYEIYNDTYGEIVISVGGICFQPHERPYDDPVEKAVAGAESIHSRNHISAEFSELTWSEFSSDYYTGYWGENGYTCTVREDSSYVVELIAPYYHFKVSDTLPNESSSNGGGLENYLILL